MFVIYICFVIFLQVTFADQDGQNSSVDGDGKAVIKVRTLYTLIELKLICVIS